ncbi:MAG: serine hydrolase [Bradymonadales bacterium]|nr:serine hydrolase [Bradymonadales bacterium]
MVRNSPFIPLLLALTCFCAGPSAERVEETTPPAVVEETASGETPAQQQLAWMLDLLDRQGQGVTEQEVATHMTDQFAEAVPPAQILEIVSVVSASNPGLELDHFEEQASDYHLVAILRSDNDHLIRLRLATEEQEPYRLSGLHIRRAIELELGVTPPESWPELDQALRQETSQVSFLAAELVEEGFVPIYATDPDRLLAIGSAFKLYILLALARQVAAGELTWEEPLALRAEWRSLPSGQMQSEEIGSEFPIRRYAELMISISDNTATDHLLHRVGRDAVQQAMVDTGHSAPEANIPFITTREMFILKLLTDRETLDRYLAMPDEEQLGYLDEEVAVADLTPAYLTSAFWTLPFRIDELEWFATAEDLCRVMAALRSVGASETGQAVLDILSINPGVQFNTDHWPYIGYKGGSEPGVLNMSWLLRRDDGRWFVMSASFNDYQRSPVTERVAILLAGAAELLYATP